MIRNKVPRYRNLQNLHVIPTAPTVPVVPIVQPASNVLITVQPTASIPETPVTSSQNTSDKNFPINMYSQNKLGNRRPRRRNRKRKGADRFSSRQTLIPNKNYDWYNSNYLNPVSFQSGSTSAADMHENLDAINENSDDKTDAIIEEAESYLETHEEDFEEVEVASVDAADDGEASADDIDENDASVSVDVDEKQEILVGFRTSKIRYLSYKNKFFKPKVYNFSSQRTLVNCLNVQDNSDDVDVVSEADYEIEYEGEILDQSESQDYLDKIEIDEENIDDTADVIMENDSDAKVDSKVKKESIDEKTVKGDHKLKHKDSREVKNLDHKNTQKGPKSDVKTSTPVDTKSVKSSTKTKTNDSKAELNISIKASNLEVKSGKNELIGSKNQSRNEKSEVVKVQKSTVKSESTQKVYKTSIENNDDIHQGKCAIQCILDSWESHLIGLEYLIEIQKNEENSSTMYNCILCSKDLYEKEFSSTNVISHINGRKHVVKYLEKHFPSCGIKFCDSSDSDFLVLQKICEEINTKLGYYYMCITNFDFYRNHKKEIIDIAHNASHSTEESLKLSKDVFEKKVESDLLKEVKNVLSCLIKNIDKPDEISKKESNKQGLETTLSAHKPVADSVTATNKTSHSENKNMAKTFKKCKGNASLTSFLKLKFANNKFERSKPVKGPSTKAVKEKSAEIVGAVKEKCTAVVDAVKEKGTAVVDTIKEKGTAVVDAVKEKGTAVVDPVKEKSTEVVGSVKEITTTVVSAEKENTKICVKKAKNTAIVGAKKGSVPDNVVAEDKTVTNEDPVLGTTKPIYQTGMVDDAKDSDSSVEILEIKDKDEDEKLVPHSKHCRKILVSVNQVMLINLIQANLRSR